MVNQKSYNLDQRISLLSVIPRSYLIGIIKNKKYSKSQLSVILSKVLIKKFKDPFKKLKKITNQELVEIYANNDIISGDEIKKFYYQFRDNKDPIFFLYKFHRKMKEKMINFEKNFIDFIDGFILDRNCDFISGNEINDIENLNKIKNFKIMKTLSFKELNIYECKFDYLERIDYLDENYTPKHVYSIKWGFFWIDFRNFLVIIKLQNEKLVSSINSLLEEYFETESWKFQLQESIIDQIFDKKDMIKNSLKAHKNAESEVFRSLIIRDANYEKKSQNFKFLMDYERKSSKYHTEITGFLGKLGVTVSQKGKISLSGQIVKLDKCRDWLIVLLKKIIEIQEDLLKKGNIQEYIRSNDIISKSKLYKSIVKVESKKLIYDLIEKICILKSNPETKFVEFPFSLINYYYWKNYLNDIVDLNCENEECNHQIICPNKTCESLVFKIKKEKTNSFYLECMECHEFFYENEDLICLDNHKNELKIENCLYLMFSLPVIVEINQILKKLNLGYKISQDKEVYYIHDNKLYRNNLDGKLYYVYDELPAFSDIPKLENLSDEIKRQQVDNIKRLREKCEDRKAQCRGCHIRNKKGETCLLRIFSKISNGQSHPHSGDEFGDLIFPQKFSSTTENIVGIVKSYGKLPSSKDQQLIYDIPFGILRFKKDDRLLTQVFQMCKISSIRFIMIISGRIIESRLRDALISIARWRSKKIVIIGPQDLIPIIYHYGIYT